MNNDCSLVSCDDSLACRETGGLLRHKRVTVYDIARNVGVSHTDSKAPVAVQTVSEFTSNT